MCDNAGKSDSSTEADCRIIKSITLLGWRLDPQTFQKEICSWTPRKLQPQTPVIRLIKNFWIRLWSGLLHMDNYVSDSDWGLGCWAHEYKLSQKQKAFNKFGRFSR